MDPVVIWFRCSYRALELALWGEVITYVVTTACLVGNFVLTHRFIRYPFERYEHGRQLIATVRNLENWKH